jgi:hypothetical protein
MTERAIYDDDGRIIGAVIVPVNGPQLPEWAVAQARELLDGAVFNSWSGVHEEVAYALVAAYDAGRSEADMLNIEEIAV